MGSIFERLGIDGKLLIFQIVNFSILLFVLTKVLYKPLLGFLESRQKRIEDSLKRAEKIDKEWEEISRTRKEEMSKIENEAVRVIEESKNEAERKSKEIIQNADIKVEKIVKEAKENISKEREAVLKEVKEEIADYVVLAVEKILKRSLKDGDEKGLAKEALKALKETNE